MPTKPIEHRLSRTQKRTVMAVGRELGRLQQELQEMDQAMTELAYTYARQQGWAESEGTPHFEQRSDDQVVLVIVPKPEPEPEAVPEPEPEITGEVQ